MLSIFIWLNHCVLFPMCRYSLIMITLGVSRDNCPSHCIAVYALTLIWEAIDFHYTTSSITNNLVFILLALCALLTMVFNRYFK